MANSNPIREPQQKRSIEKKGRILSAAYKLFCEKGYYKTNTPDIAAGAGVSIGCLYSYFSDKRTIFMELLKQYEDRFIDMHDRLLESLKSSEFNPERSFTDFINMMIEANEDSKDFQRELKILYYSDAEIAAKSDAQKEQIQSIALGFLNQFKDQLIIDDYEAAAIVTTCIIDSIVDRISFFENKVERERILSEGVKALCRYMMG